MTPTDLETLKQELQLKLARDIKTVAAMSVDDVLWLVEKARDVATENERVKERDTAFNAGMVEGLGDAIGAVRGALIDWMQTPAVINLLRDLEQMKRDAKET